MVYVLHLRQGEEPTLTSVLYGFDKKEFLRGLHSLFKRGENRLSYKGKTGASASKALRKPDKTYLSLSEQDFAEKLNAEIEGGYIEIQQHGPCLYNMVPDCW